VTALLIVLAISMAYRHDQIPASVEVAVKLRLFRGITYGSGSLEDVILKLARDTRTTFDNVTLMPNQDNNRTSDVYWRLIIFANESASGNVKREHEVIPSSDKVGVYTGVVVTSLNLKGTCTIWVVLYTIHDGSILNVSSFSEIIRTY
jgi:hypothetical protein